MKQLKNDNAANRSSYVGHVFNVGERKFKKEILKTLPKQWADLHKDGDIYIHDLDAYGLTYNCLTFDIINKFPYDEFNQQTDTGKILRVFEFIKEIFRNIGNEQSGGMAYANFDVELSTILKTLNVDYKTNKGLIEESIAELILWANNNHTRMGQTSYYVTLNLGLGIDDYSRFITKTVITKFMDLGEKVFKPNIIFKVKEGINFKKEDPNYDLLELALKSTAMKMIPTYILADSKTNKGVDPYKLAVMGCRTRVVDNLFGERNSLGRGNITNISINLPRIALKIEDETKDLSDDEKFNVFYQKWEEVAKLTKDILLDRYYKVSKRKHEDFPTNSKYHLWNVDFNDYESLEDVFKHGTLSLGFIGLSEAVEVLTGKKYYADMDNYIRALGFVSKMRNYVDFLKNHYNLNFSLLATSGELISGWFTEIDEKEFKPKANIFEKGYYTNSFHVDVDSNLPGFKKIQLEGMFHELANGGAITYLELGEAPLSNIEGLKEYIDIAVKHGVHYLGFNFPKDICNNCDNVGVFDTCPACNSDDITRIRRVSGYLEILDGFTKGKKNEEKNRKRN